MVSEILFALDIHRLLSNLLLLPPMAKCILTGTETLSVVLLSNAKIACKAFSSFHRLSNSLLCTFHPHALHLGQSCERDTSWFYPRRYLSLAVFGPFLFHCVHHHWGRDNHSDLGVRKIGFRSVCLPTVGLAACPPYEWTKLSPGADRGQIGSSPQDLPPSLPQTFQASRRLDSEH